jgi:hypothetical protein
MEQKSDKKMNHEMANTEFENAEYESTEFKNSVVNTLAKSLTDIDAITLQRLKNARENAVANKKRKAIYSSPKWIHVAVAASFILLISMPALWVKNNFYTLGNAPADFVSQDLDDIEMLMAADIEIGLETGAETDIETGIEADIKLKRATL